VVSHSSEVNFTKNYTLLYLYLYVCVTDGNEDDVFSMDPENGNVIIARKLDWETCSRYNLSIMATDGVHRFYTSVCGLHL